MRYYLLFALILALYALPWLINPPASLSPNAYDLAEWTSLHYLVRTETPMLLTPLLLRLPLACVGLLIAFSQRRGWLPMVLVLLIVVALLPPLEFIKQTGDPNYRQQAALAVITLIGGAVGVSQLWPRARHWIAAGIALIGAVASLIGLLQGYQLMRGFDLPTQIGLGGAAAVGVFLLTAVLTAVWRPPQTKQGSA